MDAPRCRRFRSALRIFLWETFWQLFTRQRFNAADPIEFHFIGIIFAPDGSFRFGSILLFSCWILKLILNRFILKNDIERFLDEVFKMRRDAPNMEEGPEEGPEEEQGEELHFFSAGMKLLWERFETFPRTGS